MVERRMRISEVAEITGISERTLKDWCIKGKIVAYKVSARGWWYIDIVALASRLGIDIDSFNGPNRTR